MARIIQYLAGMSNGFFIIDNGTIAIDTGSDYNDDTFLDVCKENGIDPKVISLIIITHGHVDHFINAERMRVETGAPILCHKEAESSMVNGLEPYVLGRTEEGSTILERQAIEGPPCEYIPKVVPDIVWEGNEFDLSSWGVQGKIIHTPGHSKCSTAIFLESGDVFVGDTILEQPDTQKGGLPYFTYSIGNDDEIFSSVEKILDKAKVIYSGHGGPFTKEEIIKAINLEKS